MQNKIFYLLTISLVLLSYFKDKEKTKLSLKKAWKSFVNILPKLLGIFSAVGIIITFLNPETIGKLIGDSSGWSGVILAAIVGCN